jgi:hypothetical protein
MPSSTGDTEGTGGHADNDHGTKGGTSGGNAGGHHVDHDATPGNSEFGHSHKHDKEQHRNHDN